MRNVRDPALDGLVEFVAREPPGSQVAAHLGKAALEGYPVAAFETPVAGVDAPAQEGNTRRNGENCRVEFKPGHIVFTALAFGGFFEGDAQVFKAGDLFVQVFVGFHGM